MSAGGADGRSRPYGTRTRVGVAAVVAGVICGSAAFAALSPTLGTPDETAHLDYAYQVWQGHLPVFEDGITFTPGPGSRVPPVQWEAQHPPLYYLLLSPVVGPLVEHGNWKTAVMAARLVNIALAACCLLALAWAGSLLATTRQWAWAIAVPAAVAPISPFMRVGGSVYNDNLAVLFVVLALGGGILVLRRGLGARRLALVALVCGLGALSRANFVVTLIVVSGMLAVGAYLHSRRDGVARVGLAALPALVPWAAALAASGWFYRRNIELTGSWTGAHNDWAELNLGRTRLSIVDVLTSSVFWDEQIQLLRQPTFDSADWLGPRVLLVTASAGLLALVGWSVRLVRTAVVARRDATEPADGAAVAPARSARREPGALLVQAAIGAALAAQVVGLLALEVLYVSTGGGAITRYLLPALLPIGAVLAAGVLSVGRRLAGLALLAYVAFAWGLFGQWLWLVSTKAGFQIDGLTSNNVSWLAVWEAAGGLAVVLVVQAVALTDWSRRRPQDGSRAERFSAGRSAR